MLLNRYFWKKSKIKLEKCEIKEIDQVEANKFLKSNHFFGICNENEIDIALFFKNEIRSLICFKRLKEDDNYELLRCYSSENLNFIWSYFMKKYNPNKVIFYCDLGKEFVSHYKLLGFEEKEIKIIKNWNIMRTKKCIIDNEDIDRETMIKEGFVEVYGCGLMKMEKIF